ncbi:flagellar export chaperone FlgN [Steroidobacter sp.]|uniref:flagellar export chaperone FlgN n=1 Tax=Steroidobacter sp. TaxID=1978227 RepID=UPI001A3CDD91|nr:flagellar export chaperone FlgN [Steroidobacter sp.]MBL8265481.1 flagellar export chaperone FlgN [Steroidobacter sp.]
MTAREALGRLVKGVHADLGDYRALRELLDAQFEAALQHRSAVIGDVANRISELTTQLETRRKERVALAKVLIGKQASVTISAVAARLPNSARPAFNEWWNSLEKLVQECKRLNQRNCNLLMSQHEILQRVLQVGSGGTYAPS